MVSNSVRDHRRWNTRKHHCGAEGHSLTAPSREDFDRWREDFVTGWVFAALRKGAADQQEQWHNASWVSGAANPANDVKTMSLLRELRTRADAYQAMEEASYEAFCEMNGDDPNDE